MKKSIIAAAMAVCLMAVSGASAQNNPNARPQERPTAEQMAQRMTDRMSEKLNLTDAQKKEVYNANLDRAKQMEKKRDQQQDNLEKMKKENEAADAKMKSVLNEEQYAQWKEMQKESRQGWQGRGHGPQMKGGKPGQPNADGTKPAGKKQQKNK